jgi:hypothetical protein
MPFSGVKGVPLLSPHEGNRFTIRWIHEIGRSQNRNRKVPRKFVDDIKLGLIGFESAPGPMISEINNSSLFQHEKHCIGGIQREFPFEYGPNGTGIADEMGIGSQIPRAMHTAILGQASHEG